MKLKIVSSYKYKEILKNHGSRATFIDLKYKKGHFMRVLLNLKQTQIFIPTYFAEKILNENI